MASTVIQANGGPSPFLNYVALTVAPNSVCDTLYSPDYDGTTQVRSVRACVDLMSMTGDHPSPRADNNGGCFPHKFLVAWRQICYTATPTDTCQSDSGGPSYVMNPVNGWAYQTGITSYGGRE